MALQGSGTITLAQIQTEFGGSNPIGLSEYYRAGSYVPDTATNSGIPTSGAIDFEDFYNGTNYAADLTATVTNGVNVGSNKDGWFNTFGYSVGAGSEGSLPDDTLEWSSGATVNTHTIVTGKYTTSGTNQDAFTIHLKSATSNWASQAAFESHIVAKTVTASYSSSSGSITMNSSNGSVSPSTVGSEYRIIFSSTSGSTASQNMAAVFNTAGSGNTVTLTFSS